jgi:hypothetical protein
MLLLKNVRLHFNSCSFFMSRPVQNVLLQDTFCLNCVTRSMLVIADIVFFNEVQTPTPSYP